MEKEFQQKPLAGPGVSSSHVDTAQPIIYVTSVAPHSSLGSSSAQARQHSCLCRGGGQRDSLETAATPGSPLKIVTSL